MHIQQLPGKEEILRIQNESNKKPMESEFDEPSRLMIKFDITKYYFTTFPFSHFVHCK